MIGTQEFSVFGRLLTEFPMQMKEFTDTGQTIRAVANHHKLEALTFLKHNGHFIFIF